MIVGNIAQVIISLILVLILAFIGYAVYNKETMLAVKNFNNVRKEINVFKGIADFKYVESEYETKDRSSSSFIDLRPSINQNGGAEYTYNFWLYRDSSKLNADTINSEDICLLLRGNKTKVHYNSTSTCLLRNQTDKYILVKNPLIRMKKDGSSIIVEYNSITFPDTFHEGGAAEISGSGSGNGCTGSWFDRNKGLLGIYDLDASYDKNWFMVTVILQEISPNNDILYRNKTTCKMYINGVLMLDRMVESPYDDAATTSSAMRHNKGPLYINPSGIYGSVVGTVPGDKIKKEHALMMADLTYFNYAIGPDEIDVLYKRGYTKGAAPTPSAGIYDPSLHKLSPALEEGPKSF